MTTLFIDRRDAEIDAGGGALVVRAADGTLFRAPLVPLERVVLRGPARVSTGALAALHAQGAGLLVLSGRRGEPAGTMLGRPHGDATARLGQAALALDPLVRAAVARRVVRAKLLGQARLLRAALPVRRDRRYELTRALRDLAPLLDRLRGPEVQGAPLGVPALTGIEGAGAAAYFPALASLFPPALGFTTRNRRPPRDPANAVLSLAYTLGTFEAAREAWSAGLDPMLGFLHAPAFGRESLACDLVEPLRPVLDRMAWRLFADGVLRADHFTRDGDACLLGKAGRAAFYAAWEDTAGPARRVLRRVLRPLVRACRAKGEEATGAATVVP